ncbi:MAG: guanylate kinase [Parcubacteria group bacterium]|nr:MAG: guanylate kinase [Parcubacteria group bacterium]
MIAKIYRPFIITGPSAVGKSSLAKAILKKLKNFRPSTTYTTRPKRTKMSEDKIMHYVTRTEFKKLILNGKLLEWAEVYNNYYGTDAATLKRHLKKHHVLINIDVQGANLIRKKLANTVSIFILPDSLTFLARRLEQRGTPRRVKNIRLRTAAKEISQAPYFDYQIKNYNGRFEQTLARLLKIIKKEVK